MNIEAYNLDSLRRLVRSLQDENKRLKQQLDKANIPYETEAEPMYMPGEERMEDIFRSVITVGITVFAQSSGVRSKAVRHVSTGSGQSLPLRNS